jgi:hypothetical protein
MSEVITDYFAEPPPRDRQKTLIVATRGARPGLTGESRSAASLKRPLMMATAARYSITSSPLIEGQCEDAADTVNIEGVTLKDRFDK